ncbi:MAG TPA: glycoside hydrolase family 16 protein [Tepidisphaeraceae bacterium]|jgi:beta-glucanase (GH16 family)|nr:glycoside hydrolase family 16 protein [Tepidisphaeraceae bacterium]
MRIQISLLTIGLGLCAGVLAAIAADKPAAPATPAPAAKSAESISAPAGWKLVWHDEFEGKELDRTKWDYEHGSFLQAGKEWLPGWGNNELEFYTARQENVFVSDGKLHLRAIKENYKGSKYTSGRIKTKGLFSKKYGRFEFRAKLPTGKGIWPAIWMLPEKEEFGGWAASGEIDLMEARGQEPEKVLGTLHYGSHWPANVHTGKDYIFPDHGTIADFHVYALEWEPGEIRWYVDDHLYQTQNFWWSSSETDGPKGVEPANESELNPWPAPFNRPFYIVLNVAVGGQFLGNPDASTKFPATMEMDYVRVYEKVAGDGPVKPRGEGKLPFGKGK